MNVEIGNKPLKEISQEDLLQVVIIEGCCPVIEHEGKNIWKEPTITDFNNTMFHDTVVIDYFSHRVSDNFKSISYSFYFDWKDLRWSLTRDTQQNSLHSNHGRVRIETIKFLIKQGYNVPIY